jgi:hypothetical protein
MLKKNHAKASYLALPKAKFFKRKHCCKKLSSATFNKIFYLALLKAKISKGNMVVTKFLLPLLIK